MQTNLPATLNGALCLRASLIWSLPYFYQDVDNFRWTLHLSPDFRSLKAQTKVWTNDTYTGLHTRKHGEEGRDKKVTFLLGCSVCVVVCLGCWQKKQRLSSFRIYTSTDASWLERTQFRKKKKKVSLRLQHCWMKAAQQHSKNLLFGFFFSFVFFVRGRHDMLAPRLPSFHDGSILSENFYYFFCFVFLFFSSTQTNSGRTRNLSLSHFFLSLWESLHRRFVSFPVSIESRFILMKFEEAVCVCWRGMTPSYRRQGRPSVLTTRSHFGNLAPPHFSLD